MASHHGKKWFCACCFTRTLSPSVCPSVLIVLIHRNFCWSPYPGSVYVDCWSLSNVHSPSYPTPLPPPQPPTPLKPFALPPNPDKKPSPPTPPSPPIYAPFVSSDPILPASLPPICNPVVHKMSYPMSLPMRMFPSSVVIPFVICVLRRLFRSVKIDSH